SQELMPGHVAAKAIAGKQDRPAEEGVAGALEIHVLRQLLDCEAVLGEPGFVERAFASTDVMPKARAEKLLPEPQARIGGEYEVRQPRPRLHQLHLHPQRAQRPVQMPPLPMRLLRMRPARSAHPRIDLVLDPVVIRRAHEDARNLHMLDDMESLVASC